MPVTIFPSTNEPVSIDSSDVSSTSDPLSLLVKSSLKSPKECKELLQSSFVDSDFTGKLSGEGIYPQNNGLVDTVLRAYNQHHNLILRAEDIWFAILTQFNFFLNEPSNSVAFRKYFVSHKGKKELEVIRVGNRYTVDFGEMSEEMSKLVQENIIDDSIRKWMLPNFTTTTQSDKITASMIMLSTFQSYFNYLFGLRCGLPSVTLEGESADWEKLEGKLEKLKELAEVDKTQDLKRWCKLLGPVLKRFVMSYKNPEADEIKDFWQKVVHYSGGGSGPTYLSGWLTAFTFFSSSGKRLYSRSPEFPPDFFISRRRDKIPVLYLDEIPYDRLDTCEIPPGNCSVPVKIDDNGEMVEAKIVAGMVGMRAEGREGIGKGADTVRPVSGWWVFEKGEEYKEEDIWRERQERLANSLQGFKKDYRSR